MFFSGKIFGGLLGLFLFGPVGLIIGIFLGHMADRARTLSHDGSEDDGQYFFFNTGYSNPQMVFFVGAFSMLAKLSSVDGQVSEGARRKVYEFMTRDLNLYGPSLDYARQIFEEALTKDASFENLADQFYHNFRTSPQLLTMMLDIFYRVAMEDGRLSPNEERLIDYAARAFHIHESLHDSIRRNYNVKGSSKAYAVLGLTEDASEAEIKKAYRKLILEYHPDTVAAKGLADEFKEYATKKFREIQEAYETISKERGIK